MALRTRKCEKPKLVLEKLNDELKQEKPVSVEHVIKN